MSLAPYAVNHTNSQGREHSERPPTDRSEFQRDRDRIIHSTAFRRLEYKTQVFVNHEGDLYRTRLTHSIEVAQIARSIARNLKLNEDLTEAIALAHDLGHTPFGHAGQSALNECMLAYGGFEHNLQSIRVVDLLEEKYASFAGLNLSFETREGILKHCSVKNAKALGKLGARFLKQHPASLEAQLVDIADSIAYNNHDVDDGIRSGLLAIDDLLENPLFKNIFSKIQKKFPKTNNRIIIHETIRNMIHTQVGDLITHSEHNIHQAKIKSLKEVQQQKHTLIRFSEKMAAQHLNLKKILHAKLYKHPVVQKMSSEADAIIKILFKYYMQHPDLLPNNVYQKSNLKNEQTRARICSDYIAGMTDRFAHKIYKNL